MYDWMDNYRKENGILKNDFQWGSIPFEVMKTYAAMDALCTYLVYDKFKKIKENNRIGQEGEGFSIAMKALGGGRIGIAAQALGLSRSALEKAVAYAKEREQFGRSIGQFGAIKNKLADMATNVDASRLLVWQAAHLKDQGKDYIKESSMAKLFASSTAMKAASECVQIHGGYGYMQEYGIERLMRDAKITEIYEGTSEIQRLVIGRDLLK